jgi:hypothetical protein
VSVGAPGLVPVHVGQPLPGSERDRWWRERAARRDSFGRRAGRMRRVPDGLDWARHGLEPCWLAAADSAGCAAAIEPGRFHGEGGEELSRLLAGAAQRRETALVVALIGDAEDDVYAPDRPAVPPDVVLHVGHQGSHTSVAGRRLPPRTSVRIAPSLGKAEHDLAARLLNDLAEGPLWALRLAGATSYPPSGGPVYLQPQGRLQPILIDSLGDPVAGLWISEDESQRWYVLPDGAKWDSVLGWLAHQALPELVPGALRRARSPLLAADPQLQSRDELRSREELADLETRYTRERARIEQELGEAVDRADAIRYPLLFAQGRDLVAAVRAVLEAAGLLVIDLDEELGGPWSADLLVTPTATVPWIMVEVKGAGRMPGERLLDDLTRHLRDWAASPPLPRTVAGGALVVSHETDLDPGERQPAPYMRAGFAPAHPVVSALELFGWWRARDWDAVRAAVLAGP